VTLPAAQEARPRALRRGTACVASGLALVLGAGLTVVAGGWIGAAGAGAPQAAAGVLAPAPPAVAAPAPPSLPAPEVAPPTPEAAAPPAAAPAAAQAAPAPPVAVPQLSGDGPPAAELAVARAAATRDVGVAPPELRPIPIPGYAKKPPAASFVAPISGPLRVSASPGGRAIRALTDPTDKGAPLRMLVVGRGTDTTGAPWTQVAMEERPNGTVGWVRAADVAETANPWRITVLQSRHRVLVWYGDSLLADAPVAVGAAATPTPVGLTYVDVVVDTGNPYGAYGQWILGLASHSDAYETFGGGDALIALHGTNEPASIGYSVSHGCVRMDRPLAALLAHVLPLGTRVDIRA